MKIGFIGLGQMGRGMAARLLARGYELIVWNRTPAAAEALRAIGARVAERPQQMVLDAEIVITMLADDAAVEAIWIESGLVREVPRAALHLNMSSVSLALGRRLSALHDTHGSEYVSAPVFGRPSAAASGELDIVAAGAREAITRCGPVFEALGKRWFDLGEDAAHANIVKIARNFLLATIIEGLGEAFALVQKSGVERARFLEIITSTSLSAPAYKNYGRLMIEEPARPTFSLKLGLKDVELALQAAADSGMSLPTGDLLRKQHADAIRRGYGDREWAALGNYIAETSGL